MLGESTAPYSFVDVAAHVSEFRAQRFVAADGSIGWNVHQWELR